MKFFTPAKFWILFILLLIALAALAYVSYSIEGSSGRYFRFSPLVILLAGLLLGLPAAAIPFGEKPYRQKLKVTFPLALSVGAFTILLTLGIPFYLWWAMVTKEHPVIKYDLVEIPKGLDCSSVRNGKFETEIITFERQGNRQTHSAKEFELTKIFNVEWISECEYHLTGIEGTSENSRVKITAVTDEGYECYATAGNYAIYHKCRKLEPDAEDNSYDPIPDAE